MNKFCSRCGAQAEQNAVFCHNCGAKIPQEQPHTANHNGYQQSPPGGPARPQGGFHAQQPNQAQFMILQQVASKIKTSAIFWSVLSPFA